MYKENNRSAAGLRRSAIVERIRLREEWSALKGTDNKQIDNIKKNQNTILKNRQMNAKCANDVVNSKVGTKNPRFAKALAATNEVLRGVVALVEVGTEPRALALRAALTALGATVMPTWSPLVTHLIWAQGGCRNTRRRARALACRLVSPLWVEACAASGEHLLESTFPAAPRPSDLPSPKTLRRLLKRAEMENVSLAHLLTDSREDDAVKPRLRISSETEQDTTADTSRDESHDRSAATKIDVATGLKIAPPPQRAAAPPPQRAAAPPAARSRRKLFTQKEADVSKSTNNETDALSTVERGPLTQRELRGLARAERMARRFVCARARPLTARTQADDYKIVLTGMSRTERVAAYNAIRTLNGRVQMRVNKHTTHVLLGSCREDCVGPGDLNASKNNATGKNDISTINTSTNMAAVNATPLNKIADADNMAAGTGKVRTVNALLGAVRGCRVLHAKWVTDSLAAKRWLHHYEYEVPHLRKISLKARVERHALGKAYREYAYDVFNEMRVRVAPDAEQRDGVITLLKLCGADVQDGRHIVQNGAHHDFVIGIKKDEVCSKWVFDSVAAAKMRTVRRYINKNVSERSTLFQK